MNIRDGINKFFPERFKEEEIVYICRRHKVLLILEEVKILIVLAALIALPIILDKKYHSPYLNQYRGLAIALYALALTFSLIALYGRYYNWKYDLYIITDQRVIDSNRYFPFRKSFTEADLEKVQDSTYNVPGALGYFFHFGSVKIETAGEASNFEWNGIPNPISAQQILRQTIEAVNGHAGI